MGKIIHIKYMQNTIINALEIKKLFRKYCRENKADFSKEESKKFLKFLETDFYDWVRENLKQFGNQQAQPQ